MRSTLATVAFFAATVLANIPGLPDCSQSCLANGFGNCQLLQVNCICSNTPLIDGLACCVSKQCDAADQQSVINFANAICKGSGVTDLPQTATCAPGYSYTGTEALSTSASSSGSDSSSATTTASSSSAASLTAPPATIANGVTAASTAASSSSSSATHTGAAVARSAEHVGLGLALAGLLAAL